MKFTIKPSKDSPGKYEIGYQANSFMNVLLPMKYEDIFDLKDMLDKFIDKAGNYEQT